MTLFMPLWNSKIKTEQLNDLNAALISNRFQVRVAALKKIYNQKFEIANSYNFKECIKSRHISERYWLARALSVSKDSRTYKDLFILLNDSQPIVQCQALYALGNRNRSSAITPIYHLLKTSDHWYIQWYGYKALRRLGWVQSKQKFF
jgi:HEAT repeat protein